MVTSRAVVGSSAINSGGSIINAMAMLARWRIPPLNWCGNWRTRSSGSGMPTRRMMSTATRRFSAALRSDRRYWMSAIWRL
jgi:hypothetical protein